MTKILALVESNTTGTGRLFALAGRALGLRPLVFTADPGRYPYLTTDGVEHVLVDTADEDALWQEMRARDIGAVLSSSEYFVATAAAFAARLGLPGPDPEAIRRCRDKGAQRDALAGMPGAPGHQVCADPAEVAAAATRLGGDVVVKPCQGSGSEGVRACRSPEEAAAWAEKLFSRSVNERGIAVPARVLVEQRLVGPECSVELLDGKVWGVTAKHLGPEPYFVETGHDFPASLGEQEHRAITEVTTEALRLLGLRSGPAHVELRRTARGPVVVEVNPRLAGGMIPRLVELATGQDMIDAVVRGALGQPVAGPRPSTKHASIRFLVATGLVREVGDAAEAKLVPGVVDAVCTAVAGELRPVHHSFRDRAGYVISLADNETDAVRAAETGRDAIHVDTADIAFP